MRNFHNCLYVSTIHWRRLNLRAIQMIAPKRPLFHVVAALLAALFIGFASTPGRATIHCEGNECSCIGDDDCNTLFGSGVCTDSGGSCSGSGSTAACTCTKKANVSQTKPGTTPSGPYKPPVKPIEAAPSPPGGANPPKGTAPIVAAPITGKPIKAAPTAPSHPAPVILLQHDDNQHGGKH
jgi:hypothetical protein